VTVPKKPAGSFCLTALLPTSRPLGREICAPTPSPARPTTADVLPLADAAPKSNYTRIYEITTIFSTRILWLTAASAVAVVVAAAAAAAVLPHHQPLLRLLSLLLSSFSNRQRVAGSFLTSTFNFVMLLRPSGRRRGRVWLRSPFPFYTFPYTCALLFWLDILRSYRCKDFCVLFPQRVLPKLLSGFLRLA
jgi:hypothetical protein